MIAALREKGYFEDEGPKKLIVCGDAFDRGKEAVEMQNFLADLVAKDEAILIRGNHDDLLEEFVTHSAAYAARGLLATHHFKQRHRPDLCSAIGKGLMQMESNLKRLKEKRHGNAVFSRTLASDGGLLRNQTIHIRSRMDPLRCERIWRNGRYLQVSLQIGETRRRTNGAKQDGTTECLPRLWA